MKKKILKTTHNFTKEQVQRRTEQRWIPKVFKKKIYEWNVDLPAAREAKTLQNKTIKNTVL